MMGKKEQRRYRRAGSKYAVRCLREGDEFGSYVICNDISASGIMFTSLLPFDEGEMVTMELMLPGWNSFYPKPHAPGDDMPPDTVRVKANVVRCKNIGDEVYQTAVSFFRFSKEETTALLSYIKQNEDESPDGF